jgi:DNA-binding XRE family transcriptional regulator
MNTEIKTAYKNANLSQEAFGKIAGVSYMTLIRFERGEKISKVSTLKILKAYQNIDKHRKEDTFWRKTHQNCIHKIPTAEPVKPFFVSKPVRSRDIPYNDLLSEPSPYSLPDRQSKLQLAMLQSHKSRKRSISRNSSISQKKLPSLGFSIFNLILGKNE